MVRLACLLAFCSTVIAQDPARPIRAIGQFSNIRYIEEHADGYAIDLWRDGDSVIGLFHVAAGFQRDTPTGMLDNVKFNSRTGALSFSARLTTGVEFLPGGRQEPSLDLFEFSGVLKRTILSGTLKRSDLREPSRKGTQERVDLEIQSQADLLPAVNYADWKLRADEVLKRLGPK
jgi:hypothetical protein